jgi:hypothetical protein
MKRGMPDAEAKCGIDFAPAMRTIREHEKSAAPKCDAQLSCGYGSQGVKSLAAKAPWFPSLRGSDVLDRAFVEEPQSVEAVSPVLVAFAADAENLVVALGTDVEVPLVIPRALPDLGASLM